MQAHIGLENNYEGRSLAWALDFPGCFAYGSDGLEALSHLKAEFERYKAWVATHTSDSWLKDEPALDVSHCEVWTVYNVDDNYQPDDKGNLEINAWFPSDWIPLTRTDIERGLLLLSFSRKELLELIRNLPEDVLDIQYPDERWSLRGIIGHIGNAEFWYLDRLELAGMTRGDLPKDVFEKLEVVRRQFVEVLPQLEGIKGARGKEGEWWSPRKMLRRAVEHELDHIGHLRKLVNQ